MAILFTKGIIGIYPAYNDSFVKFYSTLTGSYKAEITVYPTSIFPKSFVVYPDTVGSYVFNLKESVKVIFNQDGFRDENFSTFGFFKSISGLYLSQDILIKVYGESESEQVAKNYEFFKAVKQIGEDLQDNPFKLLSYSSDGLTHDLTYFEGFPFSFDIQRVIYSVGKVLKLKNLNSGIETSDIPVTSTGAFRMTIDNSEGSNWTSENILPLSDNLNRLELYEDGIFKTNINIKKRSNCSGVLLKWFNSEGGFSQFLFDKFFVESFRGRDLGEVLNGSFDNIDESTGHRLSTGKRATRTLNLSAKYDEREFHILKDLFLSPFVQMYTSTQADIEGRFIDVRVNGSIMRKVKKANNELSVAVLLPELITAKL